MRRRAWNNSATWTLTPPLTRLLAAAALLAAGLALVVASANAAFPGANGKIVFQEGPSGSLLGARIYTMNPDGSGRSPTWLARGGQAVWSPDGQWIAFAGENADLYIVPAGGGPSQRVTENALDDDLPAWSPDGRSLVFRRSSAQALGLDADIYRIDLDGTNELRLTDAPMRDGWPAWSPDGTRIAFSSDRTGTHEIYTMATDGSDVRQLTLNTVNDYVGDWSPDGTRLVFHRNEVVLPNRDVWTMRADGSDERQLTSDPEDEWDPAWSPDGSKITFASGRDDPPGAPFNLDIFTMNADGSGQVNLTNTDANEERPDWQSFRPTAVTVRAFSARLSSRSVLLYWRTAAEAGTLGFNVYRERLARRVKLNRSLISARRSGDTGYRWRDRRPRRSSRYFLEELRLDGGHAWHGPVAATS